MVLLLTMQRRSELALAEWSEFDLKNKRWRIPSSRTKNRREHAIPLTDWAITELTALKKLATGSRFVIPGKGADQPANPKLITRGVQRLAARFRANYIDAFTPHDLRRTGRTSLGRLGVMPFVAERVINHSKDVLEETYDLWDYFDEKRDALERWEKYLLRLKAESRTESESTAGGKPSANRECIANNAKVRAQPRLALGHSERKTPSPSMRLRKGTKQLTHK